MTYLLPYAINKSLSFLSGRTTVTYFKLLEQAMLIEGHLKDFYESKAQHMTIIQKLHSELIECKGVKFDPSFLEDYDSHFKSFLLTFKSIKQENLRKNGFRILKDYLTMFYKQIFSPINDFKVKEKILQTTNFLKEVTEVVINNIQDWHETVREEAQLLLICIA